MASLRRDEPTARYDPGYRSDHGVRYICGGAHASLFRSGRQFAAWLGLTPGADSSGGKERLGGITKQGDYYLRRLLVVEATAVMRMMRKSPDRQPWMAQLLERKPVKIATVALANKTARIAWAVMSRKEVYAAAAA